MSGETNALGHERLSGIGLLSQWFDANNFQQASAPELNAREVLLSYLDTTLGESEPNTPLEFAKAALIRDAIGDNRNRSAFAQLFGLKKAESAEQIVLKGPNAVVESMEKAIRNNAALLKSLPQK